MRDCLDVAAPSGMFGAEFVGPVLAVIDDHYTDPSHAIDRPVQAQLARQLAAPEPKDRSRIAGLPTYKGLAPKGHAPRWRNWDDVVAECRALATQMM